MRSTRSPRPSELLARELRVPADTSHLASVRQYVDEAAAEFGLDDSGRRELVFAANEAVTNAMRHGSPATDGSIVVRLESEGDLLSFSVSDSGTFHADACRSDVMDESGRGFTLMSRLVDELQLSISQSSTTVRLAKRREGAPG